MSTDSLPATWHGALHRLQTAGTPHVLATLITCQGSTPREPGARMVITNDDCFDTLGGGTFEWQTMQAARGLLNTRTSGFHLETFSLGGRSGQCCGGYVNVLLEVFLGSNIQLAIFGAGNVGCEIVSLCAPLPWQLHWYDSRPDAFPAESHHQPRLACHVLDDPLTGIAALPPHTHALVLTHDHAEDYALTAALLTRDDIASIGLIGSESKWASFSGRLKRNGYSEERIGRVRSPIGCVQNAKLRDKTPYAIALTVVTELLWLADASFVQETRGLDLPTARKLLTNLPMTTS
ncbi:xanthine dehydrogenase accessory protein XdhC [Halomonas aquamarina]|uniref:Xanthine dehydrogenase accessory protein XdhC n=1 Tax=Vreelandella aquamarina TaxID=77097 RepID=A0ACC5VU10_9GAMM|nr:xanthine dehydrogenase accessory protein XdhC [Halomonas aquamarina]MBZ5487751.1 xanthine dehydrogenase accessory protein XdhC [Halomonas aquamarina]